MQKPPDPLEEERHYKYGGMIMTGAAVVFGAMWIGTRNSWMAFGFWSALVMILVFGVLERSALTARLVREQPNRDDSS